MKRKYMLGLIGLSCISLIYFMHIFREISPQGQTTQEILINKDLIVDIFPPPLYVIDAFVLMHQLLSLDAKELHNVNKINTQTMLVAKIDDLQKLFSERKAYWLSSSFLESPEKYKLFNESTQQAEAIFKEYQLNFSETLKKNQRQNLLNKLNEKFVMHATANNKLVELLQKSNNTLKLKAAAEENTYFFFIGLLSIFFIVLTYQTAQNNRDSEDARPIFQWEHLSVPLVTGILAFMIFDLIIQFLGLEIYALGLRFLTLVFAGFVAVFSARMILAKEILFNKRVLKNEKRYREMILTILEDERKRVSRELHDGVIQLLGSAKFRFERLSIDCCSKANTSKSEIDRSLEVLSLAIDDIRRICHRMRPNLLDNLGLLAAIKTLIEDFERRTEIIVVYNFNLDLIKLTETQNLELFRIAQEILMNIEKHSMATEVNFDLIAESPNILKFEIIDDGLGFDLEKTIKYANSGLGLLHINERTHLLGGNIEIISSKGRGCRIKITIPILTASIDINKNCTVYGVHDGLSK